MEAALGLLSVAFSVWAWTLRVASGGMQKTLQETSKNMSNAMDDIRRSVDELRSQMSQNAVQTEARLTKLETRYEAYAEVLDDIRVYLRTRPID